MCVCVCVCVRVCVCVCAWVRAWLKTTHITDDLFFKNPIIIYYLLVASFFMKWKYEVRNLWMKSKVELLRKS